MKGKSVTQCAEHLEGLIRGKLAAKGEGQIGSFFFKLFLITVLENTYNCGVF